MTKRLLEEFPPHRYEEWQAAAVELLKGRPFEKTLITPTYEGFDIEPLYTRERSAELAHLGGLPGIGDAVRGSRVSGYLEGGWKVSQELSAPTPKELNGIVLEALENGQNEVNLWLDSAGRSGNDADGPGVQAIGVCGLSLADAADLAAVLKGVQLPYISLYIQAGAAAPAVLGLVDAVRRQKGVQAAELSGCVGYDPLGWLVETGGLECGMDAAMARMSAMLKYVADQGLGLQVIDVQGHAYHNGGASSSQEMAAVLATLNSYLKAMVAAGHDAAEVAGRTRVSVSVGGNYFMEIAKLRALRLLVSKLLEAYGVDEQSRGIHVHARTGLWNKTVFDPYVNMLRTTAEAFAAVVGGCDSLHVSPFDEVIRESDTFSRRIARNTHAILSEECGLSNVLDPAGGSWAVESLTDQMARKAWELFQGIEAEGGMLAALQSGSWQQQVEDVRKKRAANIQQRRDVLVGTNQYPNATEQLLEAQRVDYAAAQAQRLADLQAARGKRDADKLSAGLKAAAQADGSVSALVEAAAAGATLGELMGALDCGSPLQVERIAMQRAAQDYERLRLAAAATTSATLLQLNIGPSRRYRARADWTSAFFQVAGIEVLNENDFDDAEAALSALAESGVKAAIITSDDDTYAQQAVEVAARIKKAHPELYLLLAGAPGDTEAALKDAGVDDFVHVRVNNYQFNHALLGRLGAKL